MNKPEKAAKLVELLRIEEEFLREAKESSMVLSLCGIGNIDMIFEIAAPQVLERARELYAEMFSEEELDELLAVLQTPAAQKLFGSEKEFFEKLSAYASKIVGEIIV